MELTPAYEPKEAEEKWYKLWEDGGHFHANEHDAKDPYCIVIPPPNVTGSLHMGHALNNTLQDILARWQRMKSRSVLWMPGMDHAGIATQNVVEKLLAKEGKSRHDFTREDFEKRVWEWKAESGGMIQGQLRRLGASLDWPRERFTLDEGLSKAVRKVFVTLYHEGLIYQGERIINWCPRCTTALSDIETEYKDLDGKLYHIRYPFADTDGHIVVATTRPETMLGDTAVAVNPEDERYKDLIGRKLELPLTGRHIPVIGDAYVDSSFGTGMVKITPAHDPNDFEMGRRHGLEEINVLTPTGIVNERGGAYAGMDRYEARKKIIADLEAAGLMEKIENHAHSVGHCYRCSTVIEPWLSKQWFVKIKPLADEAVKVVEDGSVRFVPKNWEKTYFEWMRNIRDWCISRQLWWGHRIPAFYCKSCEHITVSLEDPDKCEKCGSAELTQDEDVLDTWFSSGLWPFSTLGWPENTDALKKYYPTSTLVTGFDIIFFWVARMIMMGKKFMGDVPFRDVYIHALVRDEHGQKMSKSRGNVIDPLIMMEKYGTDSLRFTLAAFAAQGRDIILSEKRIEGYRAFTNKVWNSTRFLLMNLDESFTPKKPQAAALTRFDKWILHRLNATIREVDHALTEYRFNDAASSLYTFFWNDYCDWYLELTKPRLFNKEDAASADAARQVLFHVLKTSLKLMHPFMPYITEEIHSRTGGEGDMLIVAAWPEAEAAYDFAQAANETVLFQEIVYKIRNIRGEMNVTPDKKANLVVKTGDASIRTLVTEEAAQIRSLAKVEEITVNADYTPDKTDCAAAIAGAEIFVPLKGLIDIAKETERLTKELGKIEADISRAGGKLSNEKFMASAPADIVAKEKEKLAEAEELKAKLTAALENLKTLRP